MSETTAPTTRRRPPQPECRLTDQQLAELITRERPYKVFDGNSLFILVMPSGQRSWCWRHYIRGREKVLLLGSYTKVSLEQGRAARDQARDKVQAGVDPADEKREAKLALRRGETHAPLTPNSGGGSALRRPCPVCPPGATS